MTTGRREFVVFTATLALAIIIRGLERSVWAAKPPENSGATVDLLKRIDLKQRAISGQWRLDDAALVSPSTEGSAKIALPGDVPEAYRLVIVGERAGGNGSIAVALPVAGQSVEVLFEGYKERLTGLNQVDGQSPQRNATAYRQPIFTPGKPTTMEFIVERSGIRIICDEKVVIDWQGEPERLSLGRRGWRGMPPHRLGIATWSSYRISRIELGPLPTKDDAGDALILDLYRKNKILSKPEYSKIRRVYADRFESRHASEIRKAFGEPKSDFRQWLDARRDIKEEFYLAIDPDHDQIPAVLALFNEIHDRYPEKFEAYANLAIAVAVVWDQPRAIQGSPFGKHQSLPASRQIGATENFRYYADAEPVMQGRARYLPWEFLVYLVNHGTPLADRKWALNMYLPRRAMIGKCYHDVPYDHGISLGDPPKLEGKPHTLPNLREYGGVCSCQADFASRVAKSIGVPAFVAGGKNKALEGHAWVMWVELGAVTRTGFTFSLESHGRYFAGKYYVGHLTDPHTAISVTDRTTELRLHTVGSDPIAARQAALVMRAYPMLCETSKMDLSHQLLFLGRIVEFCPGNEEVWRTLARMSREGKITKTNSTPMARILDRLFTTFRQVPDFTWEVFDDMIAFEDRPKQRASLFARLAHLYEQAGRADLSCEARLKYSDCLVSDNRSKEAIESLGATIMLFPDEGRYVPRLLDKLEELCRKDPRYQVPLCRFYQQFLPKISPKKPGDEASDYCIAMYKRAIQRFQEAGLTQPAQACQRELSKFQASKPQGQ